MAQVPKTHDDEDHCVMSYVDEVNEICEFSISCLLTGSAEGKENSLRDAKDE